MIRTRLVALLLGVVACLGCASIAERERRALPPDAIAVRYWEPEDARRRAEIIADSRDPRSALAPRREGVAQLQGIERFLGLDEPEGLAQQLARFPGRLGLLDPRTGEIQRLDAAPVNARPLAWSNDHRRLLFESDRRGGTSQIYEYDLESRTLRRVTHGPDVHLLADYGPDGRFAISRLRGRDKGAEAAILLTGEGGAGVVAEIGGVFPSTLRWSDDGRTLVYEKLVPKRVGKGYDSVVAVRDIDGEEKIIGRGREPVISHDGVWVVYAAESTRGLRLRRMRLDGSARAPVGAGSRDERMPAISPDGRYVAYVSEDADRQILYVRRFDGSKDFVLHSDGAVQFPVW